MSQGKLSPSSHPQLKVCARLKTTPVLWPASGGYGAPCALGPGGRKLPHFGRGDAQTGRAGGGVSGEASPRWASGEERRTGAHSCGGGRVPAGARQARRARVAGREAAPHCATLRPGPSHRTAAARPAVRPHSAPPGAGEHSARARHLSSEQAPPPGPPGLPRPASPRAPPRLVMSAWTSGSTSGSRPPPMRASSR